MKILSELSILALLVTAVAGGQRAAPRPVAPSAPDAADAASLPAESTAPSARAGDAAALSKEISADADSTPAPAPFPLYGDWGEFVDRPARKPRERLTPRDIEIRILISKDINEQLGERLDAFCQRDPVQCEERLRDSHRLEPLIDLRERNKSLYEKKIQAMRVDAEVDRLARELRAVRSVGRTADEDALRERLRFYVRMQIAFGHDARREYLCQLRDLVEQLEKELERENEHLAAHPDEVVEERIETLLREVDPAASGEPAASPPE